MSAPREPVVADAGHFDAKFRADPDPWSYDASPYEREKRRRTVAACGPAPLGDVLELGAAIGVLSAELAPLADRLTTIDFSPTAVALARRRLAGAAHAEVLEGAVPDDLPRGVGFDVVVASEVLYYLPDPAFARTLGRLPDLLRPGGRLVAVHWTGRAPDLARTAEATHAALRALPLRPLPAPPPPEDAGYLLEVLGR